MKIIGSFYGLLKDSINILLPRRCYVCRRRLWESTLCFRCMPEVPSFQEKRCPICFSILEDGLECLPCKYFKPVFKKMRYIWSYQGRARDLVTIMKYHPSPALCKIASEKLVEFWQFLGENDPYDLVIPIPSSKRNLRLRGFNQCEILAKSLAKAEKIPYSNKGLFHIKKIKSQASLSHRERLANVSNVFLAEESIVQGKNIVLIDDVVTTGATSQAAAIALKNKGANSVTLYSLIRSESWSNYRGKLFEKSQKNSL